MKIIDCLGDDPRPVMWDTETEGDTSTAHKRSKAKNRGELTTWERQYANALLAWSRSIPLRKETRQ